MPTDNNQTNSELDKVLKEVANEVADIYVDYFGINSPEGILEYVTSLFGSVASSLHKSGVDGLEYASKVKQYLYTNAFDIKAGGVVFAIDLAAKTMRLKDTSLDYSGATKGLIPYPDKNYLGKVIQVAGTTGVSLALGLLVPGGVVAATIASGAINNALNAIWGSLIGPHIMTIDFKEQENGKVLERKYISEGNFKDTISHNWSDILGVDIKSDINSLRRVIIQTTDSGGNIIYYRNEDTDVNKNGPLHTYEIPSGSKAHLLEFLKRFESNYVAHIKLGVDEVRKLLVNYYANYGANAGRVESDLKIPKSNNTDTEAIRQAAAHCLKELKGYALDEGFSSVSEYDDLNIYSNKHKDSRLEFFKAVIRDKIAEISHTEKDKRYNTYTDTKTNTFLWNTNGTFTPAKKIVFVDGKYSSSASGKYDIFGYSNPDTINLTKNADNVYAELGLGSDTITTGSGDDIIYTNVNTEDGGVDTEDKNTTNTVNSGEGDDTIYGSKGKDKITSGKGTNHIYAGGGSDEINVTNSGKNYIYTGISAEGREDKDNESDINTVNLTYGTNEVYGSKGIDLITSENAGKNYIITKDGDDGINIYGGEFNEIFTGKGSDTITINSAKGPNYIYTSTDSKNSEDQDTKDDINTVVITTGQNYIYGGKGVENLHILEGINNADLGNGKNIVDIKNGTNTVVISRI